jgi:regulator of cell morphogenesis and NO signaling
MDNTLNTNNTIGELVNTIPGSASVLEELGLDYYCHGENSLAEACAELGYDPDEILKGVYNTVPATPLRCERDLSKASIHRLLDHVTEEHYGFILGATPLVTQLIKKVVIRHGKSHPDLIELRNKFSLLCEDFGYHMLKEEKLFYKFIRQIDSGVEMENLCDGLPEKQMEVLKQEHSYTINLINEISRLTSGYAVPEYACARYRSMLKRMKKLELDLHRHIHEENNIIYPRALKILETSCSIS